MMARKSSPQSPVEDELSIEALLAEGAGDAANEEDSQPLKRGRRARAPLPAGAQGDRPLVAIVGRPNVGKSTLFNRLAGRRLAVVEDVAGVTRDRHYADAQIFGREYVLVDTGGYDPQSDDPLHGSIATQVRIAVSECDVVVCVLDGAGDPTPGDREAIKLLRAAKKPVLYVANKADSARRRHEALGFYELGIPHVIAVSALHGHGIPELEEKIFGSLPPVRQAASAEHADVPRIAIVGRPNAGKSSLLNRLLGEARQIVDDRPGTTVDSIDALYEKGDRRLVFIDTAGIRRKRSVKETMETRAVLQAIRAMERSDVVVLMIDGQGGAAEQDAKIAGLAEDRGRGLVLAVNKIDAMSADERKKAEEQVRDVLSFVPWAPVVRLSAKTGRGVDRLLSAIDAVDTEHKKRVPTAELNRFFEQVLERHPPPVHKGRSVRLYYMTQAQIAPPAFVCVTNEPDAVHFSYQRYVRNQIRERFGFAGVPVRVYYRAKKRR